MLKAKKELGQNFLINKGIISKISNLIIRNSKSSDCLIEVGPGQGAITKQLLEADIHLTCIEIDPRMVDFLNENFSSSNLNLIQSDVLKLDLHSKFSKFKNICVFGNLPYYIGTEILFKFLEQLPNVNKFGFMFQREVSAKIRANPNDKNYSNLSVVFQSLLIVQTYFKISPGSFTPIPKIDSEFIMLERRSKGLFKAFEDYFNFKKFVKQAFSNRRKILRNNLKLPSSHPMANKRPQELSVEEFIDLFYQSFEVG